MNAPVKYLFDNDFDMSEAPPPVSHQEVEALKQRHRTELQHAREQALREGEEKARLAAEESLERDLYRKLDELVQNGQALQDQSDQKIRAMRHSSQLLAMTIARKLAGSLLNRYPAEHIEAFFRDSLALLPDKTALRLHVAPRLAAPLQPRLASLLERNGQENALQIIEDPQLDGVNCRLVWADGGVEQNIDEIFARIEKMLETSLYSRPASSSSPSSLPFEESGKADDTITRLSQ